jgi:uncharacterized protein YbjT (DUF2867 family)
MAKKSQRVILVTGATGKQGGAVFHHLQERGFSVRILTRNPEKPAARALVGRGVDVIQGDLNDAASLTRALDEVYGVYSVQDSTGGAEAEIRQGINLADAANRSGVSHLVYSSGGIAEPEHWHSPLRQQIPHRGAYSGYRHPVYDLPPRFFHGKLVWQQRAD